MKQQQREHKHKKEWYYCSSSNNNNDNSKNNIKMNNTGTGMYSSSSDNNNNNNNNVGLWSWPISSAQLCHTKFRVLLHENVAVSTVTMQTCNVLWSPKCDNTGYTNKFPRHFQCPKVPDVLAY